MAGNPTVWFIPQGDFDPERPTLADLAKGYDISSGITWDPIQLTFFKEDSMAEAKFKPGDQIRIHSGFGSFKNFNGRPGEVITVEPIADGGPDPYGYHIRLSHSQREYWVFEKEIEAEDAIAGPVEDVVNHPRHYTSDPSGVECITITRHRNFNIGNAIKYLWRAGLKVMLGEDAKKKQIEDLKKAVFYINDEIGRLENE